MRKLSKDDELVICTSQKNLQQLAEEYNVHPSTISRVLKKHGARKVKNFVKISGFDSKVRKELRKELIQAGIKDYTSIMDNLEKKFVIKLRKVNNEMPIINVNEWEDN